MFSSPAARIKLLRYALGLVVVAGGLVFTLVFGTQNFRNIPSQARAVLDAADEMELDELALDRKPAPEEPQLAGYRIVKRARLEPKDRAVVLKAVYEGIDRGKLTSTAFAPLHGIRAARGKDTVTVLISYHSFQVAFFCGTSDEGVVVKTSDFARQTLTHILFEAK